MAFQLAGNLFYGRVVIWLGGLLVLCWFMAAVAVCSWRSAVRKGAARVAVVGIGGFGVVWPFRDQMIWQFSFGSGLRGFVGHGRDVRGGVVVLNGS